MAKISLRSGTIPKRERSLYADIELGQVIDPTLTYNREDTEDTLARVRAMVTKIEVLLL